MKWGNLLQNIIKLYAQEFSFFLNYTIYLNNYQNHKTTFIPILLEKFDIKPNRFKHLSEIKLKIKT